ncbi:DNA-binding protein EMBP-1 [Cocos nucifera]|uniref:DNA-binding protein EMBP-1 n=1 Tax=Cocos nucifera TaxID=13894 RepID=A0A8K0NDL2_COCNU|nr:DNA-binding protein EMBP-1 [Cocos nucifera]
MGSTEETAAAAEKPSRTEAASTSPAPAVAPPPLSSRESPPAQTPPQVAAHVFSNWAASLQAFYGGGAAAAAPAAAATAPYPFAWGTQRLVSPYAPPIAHSPMYPIGALYSHPSMAVGTAYPTTEPSNGKNKGSANKGSSGNARGSPGKSGDGSKMSSSTAENSSRSGDGRSEGSLDTRDDDTKPKDLSSSKKRSHSNMMAEVEIPQPITAARYGGTVVEPAYRSRGRSATKLPVSAPGRIVLTSPPTNLNIGMDLWNASHAGAVPVKTRPTEAGIATATGRWDGVTAEQQRIQDERELKRERRKQSNRESARRSRLRKQQECDELARKVAELNSENSALTVEVENLKKFCRDLKAENESLEADLTRFYGAGVASALASKVESSAVPSVGGVGSDHVHRSPVDTNRNNGKFYTGIDNPESMLR